MYMTAAGLLIIRIVVGLTLAGHGAQKAFGWFGGSGMAGWTGVVAKLRVRPAPAWAWISALSELVGGVLFAAGLLTPLGAFAIAGSMLVAVAAVHWPNGFWNAKRGYEFNLVILAAVIGVALTGPGAYSIDAAFRLPIPEPMTSIALAIATVAGVTVTLLSRSAPAEATTPQPAA
jgi:putative oxidoreductase